jgi:tetratricopeptide (TPR) repeat protein
MKPNSNSETFKQFLSIFSQLGSLVAAVVLLIDILGEGFDTPYQKTISALAMLVIAILLWVWRWPRITQSRQRRNSTTHPKKIASITEWLMKPFLDTRENRYIFSPVRRRTEGAILILTTVFALFFISQKAANIGEEISGLKCSYATIKEGPLLAISEINMLTSAPSAFVNRLYTEMDRQFSDQISVCLSRRIIKNGIEAEEFGANLNKNQSATIVVWGDSDSRFLEIHITPIEWTAFELLIRANAADGSEMEGWARVYIPQIVIGMTQFIEGDNRGAIRTFDATIKNLKVESWSDNNNEAFSRLHFLLAQLYSNDNQIESAIHAYDQALTYDDGFDVARLERGVLYMDIDHEKAMSDFNTLIDQNSELAAYAYANRATLQKEWKLQKNDYLKAIELDPEDLYNYHYLALGALKVEEYEIAIKAYEDARRFIDDETRTDIIKDLQQTAKEKPATTEIIEKIIALLNEPAN